MRFKSPGGELTWLTPLMAAFAIHGAYQNQRDGAIGFAIMYASLAFFLVLVWCDQRWAAIPLMVYFSLAILGGTALLFINGFSWLMLVKLLIACSMVRSFWEWRNRD